LLGETYAPVTLEAFLYSKVDKKIIWSKSCFVSKNKEELKLLCKEDTAGKLEHLHMFLQAMLGEVEFMQNNMI